MAAALLMATVIYPAVAEEQLPIVYVLATGGTIAGQGPSATQPANYQGAQLTGDELLAALPELAEVADVRSIQVANVGSPSIEIGHWIDLAETANRLLSSEDEDVAGIVVTHGTNTLEETAYFLSLTVKSEKPVVVVGAQRPATAMSSDGPYNLYTAVRVAASPEARGMGTLVVMNEQINAARDVMKSSTYRLEAFQSGDLGVLGYVDSDQVVFYRQPLKKHSTDSVFEVSDASELPQVDIVYSYAQASGTMLEALFEAGVDGIVLAGTGAGGNSPGEREAIEKYREAGGEAVIVRSNRTMTGRVLERDGWTKDAGLMHSDNLTPQKARILLMLALAHTEDREEIQQLLLEY
jgi:L-asparaginase type II